MLRLRDHEVAAPPAHGTRLAEDRPDDVVGLFDPALRLRDRLLRDDEHVALLQPARPLERVPEQRREVVSGPHLREPGERNDGDH